MGAKARRICFGGERAAPAAKGKELHMVHFYKCQECGNLMLEMGAPNAVCKAPGMQLQQPNTTDGAAEKHVPVASIEDGRVVVRVGSAPHPMLPEHYIEWIYLKTSFGGLFCNLSPGDPPEAYFKMIPDEVEAVYIYCNIHGLWKGKDPVLPKTFDTNDVACSPEFTAGCLNPSSGA